MAHGDYNCCALCDSKMDYNAWEAETKENFCNDCLEKLYNNGFPPTTNMVIEYLENNIDKLDLFISLGYNKCCYNNEFDERIQKLKNILTTN